MNEVVGLYNCTQFLLVSTYDDDGSLSIIVVFLIGIVDFCGLLQVLQDLLCLFEIFMILSFVIANVC